jgi:hypothetical protein
LEDQWARSTILKRAKRCWPSFPFRATPLSDPLKRSRRLFSGPMREEALSIPSKSFFRESFSLSVIGMERRTSYSVPKTFPWIRSSWLGEGLRQLFRMETRESDRSILPPMKKKVDHRGTGIGIGTGPSTCEKDPKMLIGC